MNKVNIELNQELFEPSWPYDLDDSYLELDMGSELKIDEEITPVSMKVYKRPWYKQNYRHLAHKNLRFYRRPYFHVSDE